MHNNVKTRSVVETVIVQLIFDVVMGICFEMWRLKSPVLFFSFWVRVVLEHTTCL